MADKKELAIGGAQQKGDNGNKGGIMSNKVNLTTWEPKRFDLRPPIGGSPGGVQLGCWSGSVSYTQRFQHNYS